MKIKIKIWGISNNNTIDFLEKKKINYFGLIFYPKSPRNVNFEKALSLINYNTNKRIHPVGVFVNYDIIKIFEIIKKLNLKFIQLHGKENDEYILKIKEKFDIKIIKTIGVQSTKDLETMENYPNANYFLFDYKPINEELPGGNAKSFDWSILKDFNIDKPWFISGGININNISKILENLIPYGIDISSGVEDQPGIKNIKKIEEITKVINAQKKFI